MSRLALQIFKSWRAQIALSRSRIGLSFIVDDHVFVDPNDVSTMVRSDFVRIQPAGMVAIATSENSVSSEP